MLFVYIQYTFINDDQSYINMALQVVNCLLMLCLRHWNGHLRFVLFAPPFVTCNQQLYCRASGVICFPCSHIRHLNFIVKTG